MNAVTKYIFNLSDRDQSEEGVGQVLTDFSKKNISKQSACPYPWLVGSGI